MERITAFSKRGCWRSVVLCGGRNRSTRRKPATLDGRPLSCHKYPAYLQEFALINYYAKTLETITFEPQCIFMHHT